MRLLRYLILLTLLLAFVPAGLRANTEQQKVKQVEPYGDYRWKPVAMPAFETLPKLLPNEKVAPGTGMTYADGRIVWVTQQLDGEKNIGGFLVWDVRKGAVERIKNWQHGNVLGLACNSASGELLIRVADALLVADSNSFEIKKRVPFARATVWHDMVVVDQKLAILSGNGKDINLYDPTTFVLLRTFSTGQEKIQRLCLLRDTQLVLWSSYWGASLRLADLRTETVSKAYRIHGSKGLQMLSRLASFGDNRLVLLDPFGSGLSELLAFSGVSFVVLNNGGQVTENGLGWRIRPRVQRIEGVLTLTPGVDMPATKVVLVLPIASMHHQELADESFPEGGQIVLDKLGNRSLSVSVPPLKAGEQYSKVYYAAQLSRYQVFFQLSDKAMSEQVPTEWQSYLADRKIYDLEHPLISKTLQELVPAGTGTAAAVQSIYRFAVGIPYGKGFEPAPAAIVKGSGGCTEHSYIQVALLRKAGIPARFVWNSIGDQHGKAQFDHKFAEAWQPATGWVPLEPLAGTREFAGVLINYPLAFSVMDGPIREFIVNGDRLVSFAKPFYRFWKTAKPSVVWKVGERKQQ